MLSVVFFFFKKKDLFKVTYSVFFMFRKHLFLLEKSHTQFLILETPYILSPKIKSILDILKIFEAVLKITTKWQS